MNAQLKLLTHQRSYLLWHLYEGWRAIVHIKYGVIKVGIKKSTGGWM